MSAGLDYETAGPGARVQVGKYAVGNSVFLVDVDVDVDMVPTSMNEIN